MRKGSSSPSAEDLFPAEARSALSSTQKPGDTYVQSFARGLSIIKSFNETTRSQTVSQAAGNTGLTRAAARRILLTLEGLGYVRCKDRHFQLTPKVLELGFAYLSSMSFVQISQPVATELARVTGESCSVAILDGADIVYVVRIPTRKIMAANISVGFRLSAFPSALGRVLLAALPDEEIDRMLREHPLEAHTPYTITAPGKLKDVLRAVRRQGWALSDKETHEALIALAVPLVDHGGNVVAALNVSGYSSADPNEFYTRCFEPLREAAQQISAMLL